MSESELEDEDDDDDGKVIRVRLDVVGDCLSIRLFFCCDSVCGEYCSTR